MHCAARGAQEDEPVRQVPFLHDADSRDRLKYLAEGDACLESNIFEQLLSALHNTTE